MSAISQTMKEMSKEMEQAGIIDELITEAFEDMEDPSLEEEADIEVSACPLNPNSYALNPKP